MTKNFLKERYFYIFMTILIAIIIFLFSNISTSVGEETGLNLSTFYHLGVFFMFTFFLTLSLREKNLNIKIVLVIILISLIYALLDEFHQLFVIGRFCSCRDVLTDMVGSVGAVLMLTILEFYNKH